MHNPESVLETETNSSAILRYNQITYLGQTTGPNYSQKKKKNTYKWRPPSKIESKWNER